MTLDRSLKSKSALERHRNVLSRAERIAQLKEEERWKEGMSISGLPKVAHRKAAVGKKDKTEKKAAATAEGAAAPAAPGAAAPAAPVAAGKPAKGKADKKK